MKRLLFASMVAVIMLAGPIALQSLADDAHHPEKAARAKKPAAATTRQKKPAAKTNKSKQGSFWPGLGRRELDGLGHLFMSPDIRGSAGSLAGRLRTSHP